MILYPNCSEIVGKITFDDKIDARTALQDIADALGSELSIGLTFEPEGYQDEQLDDGTTLLTIFPRDYRSDGIDTNVIPRILFQVPVPIDLIEIREDRLRITEELQAHVFERIEATVCNSTKDEREGNGLRKEDRIFTAVRLKEAADVLNIYIDGLSLAYSTKELFQHSFSFLEDEYDKYQFPTIRKLFRNLDQRFGMTLYPREGSGGSTETFEEWSLAHFPDFFIDPSSSQPDKYISGVIYVMDASSIDDLTLLLQELEAVGVLLVTYKVRDEHSNSFAIVPIRSHDIQALVSNADDLRSLLVDGEPIDFNDLFLITRDHESPVSISRICRRLVEFRIGYLRKGESKQSALNEHFFIFCGYDLDRRIENFSALLALLEHESIRQFTVRDGGHWNRSR